MALVALVASRPSGIEPHYGYSAYHHTPLLAASPYAHLDAGAAYSSGFVSPYYGSHLSHASHISHLSPYVAASPYVGHHYGLHPYDSIYLRR